MEEAILVSNLKANRAYTMSSTLTNPYEDKLSSLDKGSIEKIQMTSKEAAQFKSDPQFSKLFLYYADEISDPKYRAEQELYIEQLEQSGEVLADKKTIQA